MLSSLGEFLTVCWPIKMFSKSCCWILIKTICKLLSVQLFQSDACVCIGRRLRPSSLGQQRASRFTVAATQGRCGDVHVQQSLRLWSADAENHAAADLLEHPALEPENALHKLAPVNRVWIGICCMFTSGFMRLSRLHSVYY